MCAPVAILLSRRAVVSQSRAALALLHLGRISSYIVLGVLAGGVSQVVGLKTGLFTQLQGALALLAAGAAFYIAITILGWTPSPEKLLAGWVQRWGKTMRALTASPLLSSLPAAYGLGLLWGVLPCGMVMWAIFTAFTSGSLWGGALSMALFGLGTLPALLALRWLAGRTLRLAWPRYASALLLALFGAQFTLRGLSVWGVVNHMVIGEVMLW